LMSWASLYIFTGSNSTPSRNTFICCLAAVKYCEASPKWTSTVSYLSVSGINVTRSLSRTPASASGSTRLRRSCWRSKLTQPFCAATPCVARTSCRHAICCSIQAFSTSSKCCSASGHERCEYQASLSDLILTNT
jgi:hypothetical protein